jgi:hypothetical protein
VVRELLIDRLVNYVCQFRDGQRRCVKNGNRVKTVWGVMYRQSGQGQARAHPDLVGIDGRARRNVATRVLRS